MVKKDMRSSQDSNLGLLNSSQNTFKHTCISCRSTTSELSMCVLIDLAKVTTELIFFVLVYCLGCLNIHTILALTSAEIKHLKLDSRALSASLVDTTSRLLH